MMINLLAVTENRGYIVHFGQDVKSIFSATQGSQMRLISIFEELSTNKIFSTGPWNFHISFTKRHLQLSGYSLNIHYMLQNNQPFFFSELFNCNHYLDMLQTKFLLQLIVAGQPVSVQWFVQDGFRPYTASFS
jgi:hypothetical protein